MFRVGIIGCGKIAQTRHIPEYLDNPYSEIAGYYDFNMKRAQELAQKYSGKAYESVEEGKNGYIVDMNLSNLDIDKIINKIPNKFEYKEKCTEEDWIKLLNKKQERRNKEMYKIIAKQDYKDKRPELVEKYENKEMTYNKDGSLAITKGDIYFVNNTDRAKQIEESGLATVEEIKAEIKPKETEKAKTINTKETKNVTKRAKKKKEE